MEITALLRRRRQETEGDQTRFGDQEIVSKTSSIVSMVFSEGTWQVPQIPAQLPEMRQPRVHRAVLLEVAELRRLQPHCGQGDLGERLFLDGRPRGQRFRRSQQDDPEYGLSA